MSLRSATFVIFVATVYAAFEVRDIAVLLERAKELERAGNASLHELKASNRSHLTATLENELNNLHKNMLRINSLEGSNLTGRNPEVNFVQETLLYYENRLDEELTFIREMDHFGSTGQNNTELAQFGKALLQRAHDVMQQYPKNITEFLALRNEMVYVVDLIEELDSKHPKAGRIVIIEQELYRCERTIYNLIDRIHFFNEYPNK